MKPCMLVRFSMVMGNLWFFFVYSGITKAFPLALWVTDDTSLVRFKHWCRASELPFLAGSLSSLDACCLYWASSSCLYLNAECTIAFLMFIFLCVTVFFLMTSPNTNIFMLKTTHTVCVGDSLSPSVFILQNPIYNFPTSPERLQKLIMSRTKYFIFAWLQ